MANKNKNNNKAFTLVELIVVITILAVLGTIAFLSFQGYSKDSRNVVRLSDIGLIEKSLELFQIQTGKYPLPDDTINVTYSGGLLWEQGYFGDDTVSRVDRISNVPLDPLLNLEYTYSVFNKGNKYQIGLALEGNDFALGGNNQVHALSNADSQAYISGNYDLLDIRANSGSNCRNIAVPSMIINNLPADGKLLQNTPYDFVYEGSYDLPSNYEAAMQMDIAGFGFIIDEVYAKCSVDSISDINSYVISLSDTYGQFSGVSQYDQVSNHARTIDFIKKSIGYLQANGFNVSNDIIAMLENAIIDTFTENDNVELVSHYADTLNDWELVSPSTNSGAYITFGNRLQKTVTSTDSVRPVLMKAKTSADSTTSLKIVDFNGGNVKIYARYQDQNNHYVLTLNPSTGYLIERVLSGISTPMGSNGNPLGNNIPVEFNVTGDNFRLTISGEPLENSVNNEISAIGDDIIEIQNSGAIIDNYSLYFK